MLGVATATALPSEIWPFRKIFIPAVPTIIWPQGTAPGVLTVQTMEEAVTALQLDYFHDAIANLVYLGIPRFKYPRTVTEKIDAAYSRLVQE